MNKRGFAPIAAAGVVVLIMIAVYLFLFIPIAPFKAVRMEINYILVLILWFLFQFLIIYGAIKVFEYARKGYYIYQKNILGFARDVKKYIMSH